MLFPRSGAFGNLFFHPCQFTGCRCLPPGVADRAGESTRDTCICGGGTYGPRLMAGFFKRLLQRFSRRKVDLDELEESLIGGDVGIRMTTQIIDRLRAMGRSLDPEEVVEVCREEI